MMTMMEKIQCWQPTTHIIIIIIIIAGPAVLLKTTGS